MSAVSSSRSYLPPSDDVFTELFRSARALIFQTLFEVQIVDIPVSVLALAPPAEWGEVERALFEHQHVIGALQDASAHIMLNYPGSILSLAADPIDEADPPLTFYCRLPGDKASYNASRQELLDWWNEHHADAQHVVLIMPLRAA